MFGLWDPDLVRAVLCTCRPDKGRRPSPHAQDHMDHIDDDKLAG